jgi:hypothetical protein
VLKTAWLMDTAGNKGARIEVSAIKAAVPEVASWVIDRAIQAHGGGGVPQDYPLAELRAGMRTLHLADGLDEVHRRPARGPRTNGCARRRSGGADAPSAGEAVRLAACRKCRWKRWREST